MPGRHAPFDILPTVGVEWKSKWDFKKLWSPVLKTRRLTEGHMDGVRRVCFAGNCIVNSLWLSLESLCFCECLHQCRYIHSGSLTRQSTFSVGNEDLPKTQTPSTSCSYCTLSFDLLNLISSWKAEKWPLEWLFVFLEIHRDESNPQSPKWRIHNSDSKPGKNPTTAPGQSQPSP